VAVATAAATNNYSYVAATAVDGAGNVYLAGAFRNSVVLGGTTLTSLGSFDVFVAKFNPTSNQFAWAQRAGGTGNDIATALAVSGTNVYMTGYFQSTTAGFGPATLTNAALNNTADVFVAKLTDAGSTSGFVWAQRAGGMDNDVANALAMSGTNVYVAGGFTSLTADFGTVTLSNINPNPYLGFLASLTDPTLTATTAAAGPREPASLFPNPARGTATLRLPAGAAPAPLVLTDALGRAVRRYPAPAGPEAVLDLGGLPAGFYLLRGAGPARRLVVE